MARRWRVAVIGLGHWYSAYGLARAMPEYARAELVAAADHPGAGLVVDIWHLERGPSTLADLA